MKVAVASDHRGFNAKDKIVAFLAKEGHEVDDHGCKAEDSCDYPDHAFTAAEAVAKGDVDYGILFCGTGIGMSITANKVKGIRAALCHDELTAELSRRHNESNVLCLPADLVGDALMKRIIETWLKTEFEAGRHKRRVDKISRYESDGHAS